MYCSQLDVAVAAISVNFATLVAPPRLIFAEQLGGRSSAEKDKRSNKYRTKELETLPAHGSSLYCLVGKLVPQEIVFVSLI
jgi:hypothetical protein